ncbi:autotransporter outer membrane beta-barrel domain-containing protein [Salmonella enterica subsp. enterica serovar Eastbourne]|nr:autotransporter outer membrane beta-barrel domain-containing protein [Salmonella enterica]ECU0035127.1 autotransporter outer membrane beta-barrel domain-containing protein [Salmonella enterica subsp. enterica serovar Eastbourne]EAR4614436.1 autotransporter outer membrane beta-barrel domain-containing protein [Salmonella enterica]EAR7815189.1 autotransporter outer membrane beta-barrel domain-containing protein [Salmonella enterica]EDH3397835.1 autotransporter outer membrane beta-barrel domain
MKHLFLKKSYLYLLVLISVNAFPAEVYTETAFAGSPESWMTGEFKHQWGLETIGAHYAYARGYTGEGITLGIFDESVFPHPEFSGRLNKIDTGEPYNFSGPGNVIFGAHGTHVAGIIAAARDGQKIHGVAYNAGLISAKWQESDRNYFEALINSNSRIFNNSWGIDVPFYTDKDGKPVILPDGRPFFVQVTAEDSLRLFSSESIAEIDKLSQSPIPSSKMDSIGQVYASLLRSARAGKLLVFAAGNFNSYNVPVAYPSIPYFFPETLNNFIIVTNLTRDDELNTTSVRCGYTASYCLSAPGTGIYSTTAQTDYVLYDKTGEKKIIPTYETYTGTSMSAPMVSGAAAVLMQRFPYMTASQIASVLLTSATDLGEKGIDDVYGWGKLNLRSAIDGPAMFVTAADIPEDFYVEGSFAQTQFTANIPGVGVVVEPGSTNQRICSGVECGYDTWVNDITGHGGLTKEGAGTLVLTGRNTYLGPTLINQGSLMVNGSVSSAVSVLSGGILGGSGTVGSLIAHRGSSVVPGNPTGILNVTHNLSFEPGSRYVVEVGLNGQSDQLLSGGEATIGGGEVEVTLENSSNLLTQKEVRTLLGQQYNILTALHGVNGQFDSVAPNYLFLGTGLSYQPNKVTLSVGRNDTSFASVAHTYNERGVATAADALAVGNPVYESLLNSRTEGEARQAFRQLTGQVHADIASELGNESRYLREALNGRLRQAAGFASSPSIRESEGGAWVQMLGGWGHASGDASATGYQASTYGVLVGLDSVSVSNWRFGLASGYTRTSLNGGYGAKANSDNYHLAAYGDKQFGALSLRGGVGYTLHRIDTNRSVNYGVQSDRDMAKYSARTQQLFAEAGYSVKNEWVNLEPFVNMTYMNFGNSSIVEYGGAAALYGNKQHYDTILSTLGPRLDTEWQVSRGTTVALRTELGWQHQFGELERGTGLRFSDGNTSFAVNSVPASRESMVLKAGAEVEVNGNATLSLEYGGLVSQNHHDNRINASFNWRF